MANNRRSFLKGANAGKDIWCGKPMTRAVGEDKRVMEVVKAMVDIVMRTQK